MNIQITTSRPYDQVQIEVKETSQDTTNPELIELEKGMRCPTDSEIIETCKIL